MTEPSRWIGSNGEGTQPSEFSCRQQLKADPGAIGMTWDAATFLVDQATVPESSRHPPRRRPDPQSSSGSLALFYRGKETRIAATAVWSSAANPWAHRSLNCAAVITGIRKCTTDVRGDTDSEITNRQQTTTCRVTTGSNERPQGVITVRGGVVAELAEGDEEWLGKRAKGTTEVLVQHPLQSLSKGIDLLGYREACDWQKTRRDRDIGCLAKTEQFRPTVDLHKR